MEFPEYFVSTCCSVLKEYRLSNAFSQEDLAKKSGLARSYICDVERSARHPSLRNLSILANALNVSTSDLVHNTELKVASTLDISSLQNKKPPSKLQNQIINYFSDCSSDGLIICDQNGRFLYFNSTANRLSGLGLIDIGPENWPQVYGLFTSDKTLYLSSQTPLSRAMRGEKVDQEKVFINNEKTNGLLAVSGRPVKDETGGLSGGVILFRNVSETGYWDKNPDLAKVAI